MRDSDLSYRGKSTKQFEKILSDYIEAYVICTNTGTAALHLSLILSEIKRSTFIICPAISYVATANIIKYMKAYPIFCDVKNDLTIDTEKLEEYLEGAQLNIDAIIPVHVLGNPCDMKEIKRIAKKYKLKIIEDACQALGSWYYKKHCGTIGDFGAISFNGNKIITTGGGGCLITKSKKIYEKAIHLSTVAKVMNKKQCYHDMIGYNYRMSAWNARLGIEQFNDCKKLQYLKIRSKKKEIVKNEWKVIDNSGDPIWTPLHQLPMYKDYPRTDCSNAERIGREVRIK